MKGFYQYKRIDYDQIFAGVIKGLTWKIILVLVVINDWDIEQIDVLIVFLNPDVNNDIYLEYPPLWVDKKENRILINKDVCKLNKALYGLKQLPRFQ